MKKIIYACCILLLTTSCVSKKKWMFSEKGRLAALNRERVLNRNLEQLKAEVEDFKRLTANLQEDTARLGKATREYQSALSSNISEQDKLAMLLQDKISKLAEREATINELQAEINAQQEKTAALLNSLKDALLGFNSDELTVTQKEGKIYVAMSDKLLFESGSAQVNKQGRSALGKLAGVLKKQSEIDVTIEGHTDSDGEYFHNMELSQNRTRTVLQYCYSLMNESEALWAKQLITANGLSSSQPILVNGVEDKGLSRRVEFRVRTNAEAQLEKIAEKRFKNE